MFDKFRLKDVLVQYKKDFVATQWRNEKYKWEAVKCFQDNWDVNAEDFADMLNRSLAKTFNLLASMNNFPARMITGFARTAPEEVRSMFLALFDETKDVYERIEAFKMQSSIMLAVGESQSYTLYNDAGNKRRIFQNFLDAKAGDMLIGYESNPVKQIVAIGRISTEQDGEKIFFEKLEGLSSPIDYQVIKSYPELEKMEFFVNPNGSLFKLTRGEYEFIIDLIREDNPVRNEAAIDSYSKEEFLDEVYMTEQKYEELIAVLRNKKNIILQGAPGVGKTFSANRLAYAMMKEKDDDRIEFVQFHQNYSSFEQRACECQEQIALSRSAVVQAERSLEIVTRDLRNNKDAAKLQSMGSIVGCKISQNICPTCNQKIDDSLLHLGNDIPIMSIEENIRHLEGQKSVLEFTRDSHRTNIEQLSLIKNDLQSRLVTLRRLAQTIRSDIYSTETEWSEFIVQKLVEVESKIRGYVQLQSFIEQELEEIKKLSDRWKKYKEEYEKLPKKEVSDLDAEVIGTFKNNFINNLRKYKYKSAPDIDAVDIPVETCLPSIDGFDMKFDSSASDNIRIIWSFTIALLQTSLAKKGNHPSIIIFDEPAQHSIVTSDMESLIQSVLDVKGLAQVIVGITLNNEELKQFIESLPEEDAKIINIGEQAFKLF